MMYHYQHDDKMYLLEPDFFVPEVGRIVIYGCRMFDRNGKYLGYWYEFNMPVRVLTDVRTWIVNGRKKSRMPRTGRQLNQR